MKINYIEKMNEAFKLINELANDKDFQKLIEKAKNKDVDDWNDEECSAFNFCENLIDTAKNSFNYWGD
jgi:hypothetical protein